jgi:hypothetical protein
MASLRQFFLSQPAASRGAQCRALLVFTLLLFLGSVFFPTHTHSAEITPFYTQDQSPIIQIFGLPAPGSAAVLPEGRREARLALDVASNYTVGSSEHESLILDGESYRTLLSFRHGLARGFEAGLDIPFPVQSSGCLDGFIVGWHTFFQLPQGGRDTAPRNQLQYRYAKDGKERLLLDKTSGGIGDLRLTGAMQLYHEDAGHRRTGALRASLKLPTGDSAGLLGSGSTDLALWTVGSTDFPLPEWGHLTIFGAAGGMAMSKGKVLAEQQRRLAGFGNLGIGWGPADWIDFKLQASGHTPLFSGSGLRELGSSSLLLLIGGSLRFDATTALDIAVAEDIAVHTAPDVAFHLALTRSF